MSNLRLIQYTSPDGFATEPQWLYFWYLDLNSGHRVRVAVRPRDLPPKESPNQLSLVRELARRALLGVGL